MALSNRDRIDRGISSVTAGLAPYVLRELKTRYKDRWGYAVVGELGEGRYSRVQNASEDAFLQSVDAQALFKVMWGCYNDVFRDKLGFSGRNQLSELMEVRNNWAHNGSFNLEDTQRALDTMHRLLQAVSAGREAEEVQKHHRAVLRQIFESDERREVKRTVREAPESREGLLSWREVVDPHPDVREGRYQEAEFAADLAEVLSGAAETEYQDPGEFFRRTYLTEGMVGLLANAAQRLSGTGGDPVIQLQTVFGGGKTHSMLALYHLFGEEEVFGSVPGGEKVSRESGLAGMPVANRAVLVGTDLDAGKPRRHDDATTRTLWGEMAYQLGGIDGYDYVRESDERGVAPGAGTLKQLMDDHSPALILIDELVAFIRNIYGIDGDNRLAAGTFDSNITFVQNLTEAAKRSERAIVVVSVPVSERGDETGRSDIELGGEVGKLVAGRLEQVLGRIESVWKPVGATEGFEIVRRRLFSSEMNAPARDAVVSAYARMYRDNRSEYPSGCVESEYERRLKSAYPIHPELFDRLYEDWSTLEKFQRTRGVLRLMAAVIHELWTSGDRSYMIMPGDIPLDEFRVRNQFVRYLPDGWDAVVDSDVDGPDSRPKELDDKVGSLGRYHAARRVARSVFVGSAPSVAGMRVRGVEEARVRLGCVQPGESSAVFADALGRLSDGAAYLYSDETRHWYDTRPNVNREAADRAQQQKREDVFDEITTRLRRAARGSGDFARVHVAPMGSSDIPDEPDARLVVLGPDHGYRSGDPENVALNTARECLDRRGGSPRLYRNALVFLTPDRSRMESLEGTTRRYLAWKSITDEEEQLNLDAHGRRQATDNAEKMDNAVDLQLEEAYQWLLYPGEEPDGKGKMSFEWSATKIGPGGSLVERASSRIVAEGALVTKWSPMMLKKELDAYLWSGVREGDHVPLKQLRDDLARYLYLPRIRAARVLEETVRDGVASGEFFGYAQAVTTGGRYEGLKLAEPGIVVYLDEQSVIVKPHIARKQLEVEAERQNPPTYTPDPDPGNPVGDNGDSGAAPPRRETPTRTVATDFHGEVEIDPTKLGGSAGVISSEVVQRLTALLDADVKVKIIIEANVPEGIPENVRRDVSENCNTLRFVKSDFGS